jgi:hypothetical protein
MDKFARLCVVCGGWEHPDDPLCADGFDDDELIHLRCYNSPGARAWREQRRAAEPAYDRYWRLMTVREPVRCPACDAALDLSPKAVGMAAGCWSVHCTTCHRTSVERFSGYGPGKEGWVKIEMIRADFVRSRHLDRLDERVRQVARDYDRFVDPFSCKCGGRFSLAAKPRCPHCERVVVDTYFHVVDEPLTEEQRKRLETLFGGG